MKRLIALLTLVGCSFCGISQENVLRIYNTITHQTKEKIVQPVKSNAVLELQLLCKDTALVDLTIVLPVSAYLINNESRPQDAGVVLNALLDLSNRIPRIYGNQVVSFLKGVSRELYDSTSQVKLAAYLSNPNNPSISDALKLAGYVGGEELYRFLQQHDSVYTSVKRTKWPYALAMARMGDTAWAAYCVEKVKRLEVNAQNIYAIYPDLAYTRQQVAVDFLVSVLLNNGYTCDSPNPESTSKIDCGYRIMEMLAPAINDYPYTVGASGDLIVSDYKKALAEVREWFRQKNGSYTINKNSL